MPHCKSKNRFSWAGLLLPVFFLFALGVISIGAFPGWIRPVGAVPGTQCDTAVCDSGSPLVEACDACNNEFCQFNQVAGQYQCAVQTETGLSFDPTAVSVDGPPCPGNDPSDPGCWTTCTSELDVNGQPLLCEVAVCAPNDNFCDGLSGGTGSNECRTGVCTTIDDFDPANPSGCDYDLAAASTECRNCIPEGLATLENCGNGICEPDEGEACTTCAVDCLLPGFEDTCPLTTGIEIRQSCQPLPGITFPGPDWNVPGSLDCEDGDLCTDNSCNPNDPTTCDSTPKGCEADADFCCPDGCVAPTGQTCLNAAGAPIEGCDPDCYVPVDCVPTPFPTPPVFTGCLEGSGVHGSGGGAGCKGFSCSLNSQADASAPTAFLAFAGLALIGAVSFRKRRG